VDFLKKHKALLLVLLLAGLLRLVGLSENPCGFFRDEADKAYSTYSLLTTGRDLDGRFWPLQIKSFSAYTSPLYHWFSLPFIGVLGMTVFSTRLAAALAGTAACWAVYLLGREWGGRKAGLWSALMLAVSPWHLLFSRWANQGILLTLFVPLAAWTTWVTLYRSHPNRRAEWRWVAVACFFWALAWIAYAPARLFIPLLLSAILVAEVLRVGLFKREVGIVFAIGTGTLLLISPWVVDILAHWRTTQTRLLFLAGDHPFDPVSFARNYLLHWDPRYLLRTGDGNPRHHFYVFGQGQMSLLETAACLAGLWVLFRKRSDWRVWLLAWLLLSPVPAALTREGLPHALRTVMVVPGLAVLGGLGLKEVQGLFPRRFERLDAWTIAAVFVLETAVSLSFFTFDYPERSGLAWEEGTVEAIRTAEKARREGETCTLSGIIEYPEAFLDFVLKPDPRLVQSGQPVPGFRLLKTGRKFRLRSDDGPGLFLLRSWEIRKPPWWKAIQPGPGEEKMEKFWRLYRSPGPPK